MTKTRKLTREERSMTERNLKAKKQELEEQEYFFQHYKVELDHGIDYRARNSKRQAKENMQEHEANVKRLKHVIEVTEGHLKDGVPVKEQSAEVQEKDVQAEEQE